MKFIYSFEAFLKDTVNLNQSRVDQANDAFATLSNFLKNAEATGFMYDEAFKQGSLRQGTIIRPRADETGFDVDMLVRLDEQPGWEPTSYLEAVKKAFTDSDRYDDLVDTRGKHRCITIDYATNDFHVDVVPSIERDGECFIMNRETNQFEATDGDGYSAWFEGQNSITDGQLVRVVRLCKYLKDEHDWPVKSILLTTMLGRQVNADDDAALYADTPTALLTLTQRLNDWLQDQDEMPEVENPALPSETFTRHWDEDTFETFKDAFDDITGRIRAAYESTEEEATGELWQIAFGDQFPIADEDLKDGAVIAAAKIDLAPAPHAKPLKDIAPRGENLQYSIRIDATVYSKNGSKSFGGINSNSVRKVGSGHAIKFRARYNIPGNYEIWWQVVNTGAHAAREKQLRGEFLKGRNLEQQKAPKNVNWETTAYTGRHWIQCFAVRDGVCIGKSERFFVTVKNPSF